MTEWRQEWIRVQASIYSFEEIGTQLFQHYGNSFNGGQLDVSRRASKFAFDRVCDMYTRHKDTLPEDARTSMELLIGAGTFVTDFRNGDNVAFAVARFKEFRAQMEYHLSDRQLHWRSLVERAFLHLDRLLVADYTMRERWLEKFEKDEPACEKLGGAHLLHHGLWAFKSNAEGERTDLVLGGRLAPSPDQMRAAEALVLTEWKLVKLGKQPTKRADRMEAQRELAVKQHAVALAQAKRYVSGSMAGFELESTRYIVTVSLDYLATLDPVLDGAVTYRHINLALDRDTPGA